MNKNKNKKRKKNRRDPKGVFQRTTKGDRLISPQTPHFPPPVRGKPPDDPWGKTRNIQSQVTIWGCTEDRR